MRPGDRPYWHRPRPGGTPGGACLPRPGARRARGRRLRRGVGARARHDPPRGRRARAGGGRSPSGRPFGCPPRGPEVAALMARGLTNREIAAALVVTERTATRPYEHILNRLGLRSRTQIATWAVAQGVAPPGEAPAG